jgi:hypothetical protein
LCIPVVVRGRRIRLSLVGRKENYPLLVHACGRPLTCHCPRKRQHFSPTPVTGIPRHRPA